MPDWKLKDFQPQSCGKGETYGLRTFRGKVTVLTLLSGWCSFCLSQVEKMERMRLELSAQGNVIHFVIVNSDDAKYDQDALIKRTGISLFQDTKDASVWTLQGGKKDDIYVYNAKGFLSSFLPSSGSISTNLASKEGYANLKKAIADAQQLSIKP